MSYTGISVWMKLQFRDNGSNREPTLRTGAAAKPEDKQPCKGGRTQPGVNRLKVCAAPGIDKKNNIKPCKGGRIKFFQAVFSNAPTELQG